jgi:gliding motility-associated-like protein
MNPSHIYSDSGKYEICLTSSSSEFCLSKLCDTITVLGSKKLALPTAFSPNGDGKNDIFKLLGGPCQELDFKVFNEWGNLIFESFSQEIGWDGTYKGELQPVGSYNYIVTGKTVDELIIDLFGIVNLTR